MDKEEILKAIMELPNIETDNPISTMTSINVNDLMSAIDKLNKIPNYNDLLKENKILRENAENNYKVVDKVNWENMLLKKENQKLKENYERIYNENCILREKHNINDIGLLDENYKLKQIIDKAIEYLEQKPVVMVNGEPREIYVEDDNKLLDILKESGE